MSRSCSAFILVLGLVCVALTAFPSSPGAGTGDPSPTGEGGLQRGIAERIASLVELGRMDKKDGDRLLETLSYMDERGLPPAPFVDKAEEGLAKSVPVNRIIPVLEKMAEAFATASLLLDRYPDTKSPQLLIVLGEALAKEVPRRDVAAYVEEFHSLPAREFLTGAEMISLLGQAGFDYALTRSVLAAASDGGDLSPEWRYFVRVVLVARQRGIPDQTVARVAAGVVAASGFPRDVSSDLGFTSRNLSGRPLSN